MSVVEQHSSPRVVPAAAARHSTLQAGETSRTEPAALGIDLGSGYIRVWASGRPMAQLPSLNDSLSDPKPLVRRGRVADPAGLRTLLARIRDRYQRPLPAGAVVVACQPVLSTPAEDAMVRDLITNVLQPSRVLLTPTVRAAAIGAGAAPGPLLIADVGAHVTEVALLADGGLIAARRADTGIRDLIGLSAVGVIVDIVADLVRDLHRVSGAPDVYGTALRRGLVLVGGGATAAELAARTTGALRMPVRSARRPRLAAVHGAGLCALAAIRRTVRAES